MFVKEFLPSCWIKGGREENNENLNQELSLPGTLIILVLSVQLNLVQEVEMVQHRVPGLLPGPDGLVTEWFVYEPSDTPPVHSDANHDGDVLGQLLGVLLSGI